MLLSVELAFLIYMSWFWAEFLILIQAARSSFGAAVAGGFSICFSQINLSPDYGDVLELAKFGLATGLVALVA